MSFFRSLFCGGDKSAPEDKEKNNKKNFDILKYDGIRALHINRADYAIECFKRALDIQPDSEVYNNLAHAYANTGKLEDARQILTKSIEFEPQNPRAYTFLANVNYLLEDYESMENACQKALEYETDNPVLYYLAARAKIGLNKETEAIEYLDKAIALKEDYLDAYLLRANLLIKTTDKKEALPDIDRILTLDPTHEEAALMKANLMMSEGNKEEAEESIKGVIAANPFNRSAYLQLGEMYQDDKDYEKAIAVYNDAIEVLPEFVDAYEERSKAKAAAGDEAGAEEDRKKAEELHPDAPTDTALPDFEKMKQNIPF
jgi:tetratricopeptide (TPR) repeat protein